MNFQSWSQGLLVTGSLSLRNILLLLLLHLLRRPPSPLFLLLPPLLTGDFCSTASTSKIFTPHNYRLKLLKNQRRPTFPLALLYYTVPKTRRPSCQNVAIEQVMKPITSTRTARTRPRYRLITMPHLHHLHGFLGSCRSSRLYFISHVVGFP